MDIFIWPTVALISIMVFLIIFRVPISEFIKEIGHLKTKWFEIERIRKEIFAKVEEVQKLSQELEQDKNNLKGAVKVFIETFYLSQSTRGRFPIPENINKIIENNLNVLSQFAIENSQERQKWIDNTTAILNLNLKK